MAKVKQFTITVSNRPGAAAEVVEALAGAKVNILALVGSADGEQGRIQLVADNPGKAKKALAAANISHSEATVEQVELPNKPGALASHLKKLAARGVNLDSVYATASKSSKRSTIIVGAQSAVAAKPVQAAGAA
jgi:hypothetical protein